MPFDHEYHESEPTREELHHMPGPIVLEFGASWCGICQAFAPRLQKLLQDFPQVQHLKIADRSRKPLGRSFRVKLWPTLVFLRNGEVIEQFARPGEDEVREALEAITQ